MSARRGLLLVGLLAAGCADGALGQTGPKGLVVQASVSAASLSYDCAQADAPEPGFGACAEDAPCPSFCQQSNLTIDLSAAAGNAVVDFRVLAVRIARTGEEEIRSRPSARNPRKWTDGVYLSWDERIFGGATLKVTYDLSAPDWTALESGARSSGNGPTYRVEVVVSIDGVERTLTLEGVTREPEVAT